VCLIPRFAFCGFAIQRRRATAAHPDNLTAAQLKELVARWLAEIATLKQTVAAQREESARLKGLKSPPSIKPSGMERATASPSAKPGHDKPIRGKLRPRVSIEQISFPGAPCPHDMA